MVLGLVAVDDIGDCLAHYLEYGRVDFVECIACCVPPIKKAGVAVLPHVSYIDALDSLC